MKLYIYNYIHKNIDNLLFESNISFTILTVYKTFLYLIDEEELFLLRFSNFSLSKDFRDIETLKDTFSMRELAYSNVLIKMIYGEENVFKVFKEFLISTI